MEPDTNLEEDKLLAATTELENNNNNPDHYLVLTDAIIDVMKVKDLKNALGASNLNKVGLKAVLITRLKKAVASGVAVVVDIYPSGLANVADDNFKTSEYW